VRTDGPEIAAAVERLTAAKAPAGIPAPVWADVRAFYSLRNGAPAWAVDKRLAKASDVLLILRAAPDDGLVAADYGEPPLTQWVERIKQSNSDASNAGDQQLAELDVKLTSSLLLLARHVGGGKSRPDAVDRRWKNQRTTPSFVEPLNGAVDGDLKNWIKSIRPAHPQYASMQKALADIYAVQKKGGWPNIPAKTLKAGSSGPAVDALRQRLMATGYLAASAAPPQKPAPQTEPQAGQQAPPQAAPPPAVYDLNVEAGVKAFQDHHGLTPTGVADAATIAAMNVPIGARIREMAINLERWRWLPDDFGARHVMVNIPAYRLYVHENGKNVDTMKVIVGKGNGRHHTPVFSAPMNLVVFSPYWNIPDTIVEGETAPAAVKDPAYLSKNNIEVLRVTKTGTTRVDPGSINWGNPAELKELAFRQKPGAQNALGHVKFLMENPFNVYLHDTPADNLFARTGRALSHGCIRLEEPEKLAKYVLRDYPEWDDAAIRAAEHSGVEKAVKLREPLPVHIVYFTAWVDDGGGLHHFPDVYRYDRAR
jgi:murein L,D-transpeptidase YcbB/YkuD